MRSLLFAAIIIVTALPAMSATRIMYEDCEYTGYTTHFLERYHGSGDSGFLAEFVSEVTRSSDHHGGSYSLTYDPFESENPHAVVGYADSLLNTENLDLSAVAGRYWYFRWYQKWRTDIDWNGSLVKLLYVNHDPPDGIGDFGFYLAYSGSSFLPRIVNASGGVVSSDWVDGLPAGFQDGNWHKFEVLLDVGTGTSDGQFWVKVDGTTYASATGLTYNSTVSSTPIDYLDGWPANESVYTGVTPGTTWLDDMEIYVLDSATDIPAEGTPLALGSWNYRSAAGVMWGPAAP